MSGLLERVAEFETRPDDVIVAGFPRSGMRRSLATSHQGHSLVSLVSGIGTYFKILLKFKDKLMISFHWYL